MEYGYVRVSSSTQNIARQMDEMSKLGLAKNCIFVDFQSGKDFQRKSYQRLIRRLKKGDLVIVKSIDRLGRDYQMILEEWRRITKIIGADILVIDMPLLDTRDDASKGLVGRFISDIVLQILSFVAQNERESIKKRQAEGIRLAKLRGARFGRPKAMLPKEAESVIADYVQRKIHSAEAARVLGVSKTTFFKTMRERKSTLI
jgi:DNA invertase Pin-like site-specific DNA recombinase